MDAGPGEEAAWVDWWRPVLGEAAWIQEYGEKDHTSKTQCRCSLGEMIGNAGRAEWDRAPADGLGCGFATKCSERV
jgi:hypothetical protein